MLQASSGATRRMRAFVQWPVQLSSRVLVIALQLRSPVLEVRDVLVPADVICVPIGHSSHLHERADSQHHPVVAALLETCGSIYSTRGIVASDKALMATRMLCSFSSSHV